MALAIPKSLLSAGEHAADRRRWLEGLPEAIRVLQKRWSLSIGSPYDGPDVSCAWVAPVTRRDGSPAVLKVGMPHMEARDEIVGLRFWDGDPTVCVLDSDLDRNAMLLERCVPGTALRALPETEQDAVLACLLRRLWRKPPEANAFRPLKAMIDYWLEESRPEASLDARGVQAEAFRLLKELAKPSDSDVLLATDLHAGNVLRAERKPWLVIDPKPFVGDPAYDATQHLLNCRARLIRDPLGTIGRFSDLLEIDAERVRLWTFARIALEGLADDPESSREELMRRLAP